MESMAEGDGVYLRQNWVQTPHPCDLGNGSIERTENTRSIDQMRLSNPFSNDGQLTTYNRHQAI